MRLRGMRRMVMRRVSRRRGIERRMAMGVRRVMSDILVIFCLVVAFILW